MSYSSYTAHVGTHTVVRLYRRGAATNTPSREVVLSGDSPLVIEREDREPLDPRWRHRCELTLLSETHYQYEHIIHDTVDWIVEVRQRGELIYAGLVERGLYEEQYEGVPYDVRVTATCGLALLDDQELPLRGLPRNGIALVSLYDIVVTCLRQIDKDRGMIIDCLGAAKELLSGAYIDPDIYRTDEDGRRSYAQMGEVIDGILSSLGLYVYCDRGKWIIAPVVSIEQAAPVRIETIHEGASLESESAVGSVRIELPTDESESYVPIQPPHTPVPTCSIPRDDWRNALTVPLQQMSVTQGISSLATMDTEHEAVVLPYRSEERIAIAVPYRLPHGANGFDLSIELGLPGADISDETQDDIQAVIEAYIVSPQWTVEMVGNYLTPYYACDILKPDGCKIVPTVPEERRDEPNGKTISMYYGYPKDDAGISFGSYDAVWHSSHPNTPKTAKAYISKVRDYLPWSCVSLREFRGGRLARFDFRLLAPFPQTMEVHERGRQAANPDYRFAPKFLVIYLPMRFWRKSDREETKPYEPSKIAVGRITVSNTWREEQEYDTFVDADRGDGYLRKGEPVTLTYTTLADRLRLPDTLRGLLRDNEGNPLSRLPASHDAVSHIAQRYYATYGHVADTMHLITPTSHPYAPASVYSIAGRPGSQYVLLGSRYDVVQDECELTLRTAPKTLETSTYA